jgi:hypothetical protein
MSRRFFLGLDLGQSHDFTALSVLERAEIKGAWDAAGFGHRMHAVLRLRYLERIPLGTPYPDVVQRIADLMESPELYGSSELLVDATGVGRPVVDLLRQARLNGLLSPINITSGLAESRAANGYHNVPKRDLVIGLQLAFQKGALQIAADMPYAQKLIEEMSAMRIRISTAGNEQFGAWAEGEHDDLVSAVALSCWGVRRAYPFDLTGTQRYWPAGRP